MPSPKAPSEFQATIPTAGGDVCDKFQKAFKVFPQNFYEWYSYVYNDDGSFTDAFKGDICAIDCAALTTTGGPSPGNALATPTLTQGAPSNVKVTLVWQAIPGATYYELVRNTSNCLFGAAFVGYTVNTTIDDAAITGSTYYYYWLRAASPTNSSAFSTSLTAFTSTSGSLALTAGTTTTTNMTVTEAVRVSWTHVQGADTYDVYRNTTNTFSGATLLGNTPYLFWNDYTSVSGTAYYFLVRAKHGGISVDNTGVLGAR